MNPRQEGLSIVVPAFNEALNIRPLCERLFKALRSAAGNMSTELLIVDDESGGSKETVHIVKQLEQEGYPVRIHTRSKEQGRGLSSAVLLGFQQARFDTMLCMDADLQHEPESVYAVALPVMTGKAEFSVGSRYCGGGGFGFDWAIHRRIISTGATMLAMGISNSSDPMSGFFCTTKKVLARGANRINPIGFKIGLEIMARCRANPVLDVPITFQSRIAGESKLTMKQNIYYVQQLLSLYWDRYPVAFVVVVILLLLLTVMASKYLLQWRTATFKSKRH
jgi:dolichol-phosphate mannosyltransferase